MSDIPALPPVAPPVWDSVPATLATRQQWLLWKFEAKEGQAKPGKIPYYVAGGRRTGGQGEDRDRQRLATLAVARKAYERGGWHGVGFAFLPDDGLIGIDLDGQLGTDGQWSERCRNIVAACDSFTEISPSGKGVHIFVEGQTTTNKSNDIGVEVFAGRQFFTFTANRFPGTPADVRPINELALRRLHKTIDDAKAAHKAPARPAAAPPAPAQPGVGDASGGDDFRRVNDAAMHAFGAWVPALFGGRETVRGSGYRVTSKALGRDLQEDLSIAPEGIVDFGVADMGDPKNGARTPIDLVLEWLPAAKPADALRWLASAIGIELSKPERQKKNRDVPAPAGGAGNGGGNAPPPGDAGADGPGDESDDDLTALWGAMITRGEGRKPVDCRENVLYCMRHDPKLCGLVRHNQFTELHERSRTTPWGREPGEWDEEDDLMLGEYLARRFGLLVKATANLRAGVLMAARVHKFNPVVDLIRSETWDGVQRLPYWLADCLGVEQTDYSALIGECFIKGMVNRALRPGCKFDYMLILKGPQGAKKSTIFRELAAPWFTDNAIRMGDKDSLMALQSIWIAESSELESMNKSESKAIKQFLSASEDLFRPPYGARMLKRPRHAVFGGTTNDDTFLRDATGDRRFWPIEVGEIRVDLLQDTRLQLFAEALTLLESDDAEGRRTYPTPQQERALIFPAQERFKMTDVWEDALFDYVSAKFNHKHDDPHDPIPARREFFSTKELFLHAIGTPMDRIDANKIMETRIANCMRALGFDKHRETGGERKRGYMRRPVEVAPVPAPGRATAPAAPSVEDDSDLPF